MTPLTVPPPELSWKPPGPPQIEQPVELKLPALRFEDGIEAAEADMQKVGAYVYRYGPAGEELWNETEQRWGDAGVDPAALPPVPFVYKAGEPLPWQGTLIAIGQKDKDDKDRFGKAVGGEPRYRVRAYAQFKRDGAVDYAGLSELSSELAFVSGLDNQRFGVEMTPEQPDPTERVRVQLKNASLAPAGYLEIRTTGGHAIEIKNFDPSGAPLAIVQLAPDGSIHLQPAPGQKIVLEGDVEARRIRYLSSDGVTTKDLA
jgi:hypothetical protein